MIKTYDELIKLKTFRERFEYLKLGGAIGQETFGYDRYLNQVFYTSDEWKSLRNEIIIRDNGNDMAFPDFEIRGKILIHHINPITLKDIYERNPKLLDPNNLICVSMATHNAIHYGSYDLIDLEIVDRRPNDTCPWKDG